MQKQDIKISLSNFNNICRVCLAENGELQTIYGVTVENEKKTEIIDLVTILKRYCSLEVNKDDDKPQQICKPCIRLLCESYTFFDKCCHSNVILDCILSDNKTEIPKDEPSDLKSEVQPLRKRSTTTQETSYFSESEDDRFANNDCEDDSDWEPAKQEPQEDNKRGSLEEMKESDDDGDEDDDDDDDLEVKGTITTKKRGRPRKSLKTETADTEAIENQHKELVCRLCGAFLPDINASIDHYDEFHAPELEIDVCIFCEKPKKYKKRDSLLYHMGLHSKESKKCIPCRKYFKSKELLKEHLNECFKVDQKTSIKLEDSDCDTKPDISLSANQCQLSQKVLKSTQYDGAFTCQLCHQHLGEIDFVISHFEKDHSDDLVCIICLRNFSKQVPLFHLGLHSEKSQICRPCRLFFRTKEEYEDHMVKYDHDKSLSCKICGKKFTRNYKKNKHMLSHLKEKNYSCNKCGKTFTYKTSLVRHFKMHFGKRFLCSSCGNAYTTKFMLQRHIRIMHTFVDDDGKPLPKPPPKPVRIQCEFCGEIFTTKYGYGRHIRRHPEFKEFKCKICSFMCDTRDQLDVHMENKHNKHTCDVCGKRFPFESELKTHHRKHEDMEMARFRCDVCGKTARTQTQLKVHYRIHTGERPFACETCGKSFKQTAHLKVHMFQHTGKMPFKCDICDKTFPFQHVMEIHMRTHTGEKPFQCMFCGNAYHDRTTMQKHQKKKHPEIPIQKASEKTILHHSYELFVTELTIL
ncbi:unnamed protein product [Ceutorhynchus assimilis]|uniref:Zinc finger protein n=1 Tax=Ceutorhynchus assimilis TaxID=467358 RepID=A0A9N9MRJ6_9CUCU|nr:unnamed protein product [Ceutorhynchus assimilis]